MMLDVNDIQSGLGSASTEDQDPVQVTSCQQHAIALYDRDQIAETIGLMERRFVLLSDESLQPRSPEETTWAETLQRIADDPRGPTRPMLLADDGMLSRLTRAAATSPHFAVATGLLERGMRLSMATGRRLRFPPLLLLGANGTGKTHYAGLVSAALNASCTRIAMNLVSDRGRLGGLSLNWRGARPGELARGALKSQTSSPIFFLDEIDKATDLVAGGRSMDVLLSALEEENAKGFVDEYLTIPVRLDHALWIMTANRIDGIPQAVVDRLLVVQVDQPSEEHADIVTRSIFQDAMAPYGDCFSPCLEADVLARLRLLDRRRMKRLLNLALGFMCEDKRRAISVADLERAEAIDGASSRRSVGFF